MERDVRAEATRLATAACPLGEVRRLAGAGEGPPADLLRQAAALGWAGVVPGASGPRSVSVPDAAVMAEVRGAHLQPGPFTAMNAVASAFVDAGDRYRAELSAVAAGELTVAWLPGALDRGRDTCTVVDRPGRAAVLRGEVTMVQDAHRSQLLLVSADDGAGVSQLLVPRDAPGVTVLPLDGLDITRTFCQVRLDEVAVDEGAFVGPRGAAADSVERQLGLAALLTLWESLGGAGELLDRAVAYARERVAFGRPIGSYQAIKHLLVDASVQLELGRALATAATEAVSDRAPEAAEVVSMAKAFAADAAPSVAHACWQTFGGVAYMWEHDFHLYLRRLSTDAVLYGDASWHHERIFAEHGL